MIDKQDAAKLQGVRHRELYKQILRKKWQSKNKTKFFRHLTYRYHGIMVTWVAIFSSNFFI